MSSTVFPAAPPVLAAILGVSEAFPVHRIYCVGRNYAAHRREMGGDDREPPFFFTKPADAIVSGGSAIAYPAATDNLHHEVELVVAIGVGGRDIPVDRALSHLFGYAVGVDLTRRDLQNAAKQKGHPWDSGKAFDQSAPLGPITPCTNQSWSGAIRLTVNGVERQSATLGDMIWNVAEVISECSRLWRLLPGDLIYTGTPEGVGPLVRGDEVRAGIDGLEDLIFTIS